MSWIDQVSSLDCADVAARLGYDVRRHASSASCPCPACGAERRHTKSHDRRGAVGIPKGKPGWRCFQCDASGDAVDLVAYRIAGRRFRELEATQKAEVRGWFGLDGSAALAVPPRASKRDLPVEWENAETHYPPAGQVEWLWDACCRVTDDHDALSYLAFRGIEPGDLVEHDCVRVLPVSATCPEWATVAGVPWTETQHRLIVPLYDWRGELRSVLARSVDCHPRIKSAGAKGYGRRGLVMAATYGRQMLVSGPSKYLHRMDPYRVTIHEGEISFLRSVASGNDCEVIENFQPAAFRGVIGIFSGSFTRDVASRIPSKSDVVISTDDDDQGKKYAADIQAQLGDRVAYTMALEPNDSPVDQGAA